MTDHTTSHAAMNGAVGTGKVRVWDPLFRIFHWSRVASFAVAWFRAEELSTVHEITGYTVAGLVAFRMVWGLVGSRYAQFTQFIKGPGATMAYLGDILRGKELRYLGHNPAGAAMVLGLLMALSATAFTGWLLEKPARLSMLPDLPQIVTSTYADDDGDGYGGSSSELIEDMHETFANLMLLVALHVAGVVLTSFRHHENLPRSMITGEKRVPGPGDIA